MSVCVRLCKRKKKQANAETVVRSCIDNLSLVELWLLAWIQSYRNGMPGSDIIFLVVFHHKSAKSVKPLRVCSCGFSEPDCQQQRPWQRKTHRCLLYALCFYSSWVRGQFIGLSEVPSEKPDLKPALGHLTRTLKWSLSFPNASFHHSQTRQF